jgi:hypothetical protein
VATRLIPSLAAYQLPAGARAAVQRAVEVAPTVAMMTGAKRHDLSGLFGTTDIL